MHDQQDHDWKHLDKDIEIGLCHLDAELHIVDINNWLAAINGRSAEQSANYGDGALNISWERREHVDGKDQYVSGITRDLLSKPYNDEELAVAVRRKLDAIHV